MKTNFFYFSSLIGLINSKRLLAASLVALIAVTSCTKDDATDPILITTAPTILLGNDTTVINSSYLKLNAISVSVSDSGRWTIISGVGGSFENATLANTQFSGLLNTSYKLSFVAYNVIGSSADTLLVTMKSVLTPSEMVANLHWLGNSDFRLESAGKVIYVDHISLKDNKPADVILITHSHYDHFSAAAIAKIANEKTVILGPADCKYKGICKEFIPITPGAEYKLNEFVAIKAVAAYNIVKTQYHPKANKCVGYLITSEGVTVYHAGDTERIPEMKEFTCDIALMPLGPTYTMSSVDEAMEAIKDVKAQIAIPMHFGANEGTVKDAESFKTKLFGTTEVIIKAKE